MIEIKIDHKSRVILAGIDKLDNKARNGMRYGLFRIGKLLKETANQGILRTSKTGQVYKYKNRNYRASAPGEYPANRSGRNRRSIAFNVVGKESMNFGAGAKYSPFLERKAPNRGGRAFLARAIEETVHKQKRILTTEMNRAIKR